MNPLAAANEAQAPQPRLGELFELSLSTLVSAPRAFAKLEGRPAPASSALLILSLAWGGVFFALNLIQISIAYPNALNALTALQVGVASALGFGLWAALYLLVSCFIYGLGRALGSAGNFRQALCVAAFTLTAAPLQAPFSRLPVAWTLPVIAGAWVAACGLTAQFKARPWAARGACAVFAAAALALQYAAGAAVETYSAARLAVAAASSPEPERLAEFQRQMESIQEVQPSGTSSLDLLRAPAVSEDARADPARELARVSAEADALNKSAVAMLDSIAPMLDNPAIIRGMTPRQKSDYAELRRMIRDMKAEMSAGSALTPQEQQANMLKIQQLMMRVIGGAPEAAK
jgi:hypothetical protein